MRQPKNLVQTLLALLLTALPSVGADASESDAPEVGDLYQKSIDRAWQEAAEGKNPSSTCAAVKGRTMGSTDPSAFRALFACNVDIPTRYFETYLDQVEAGKKTCRDFMMEFMTKLSALTMSTDSLQQMADSMASSGDADSAVTEALGSVAEEAMNDTGFEDPKRLIKNRLSERTREVCPEIASVVLR